jgi:hypothetical protein
MGIIRDAKISMSYYCNILKIYSSILHGMINYKENIYFKLGLYTVPSTVIETMLTYFLGGDFEQIRSHCRSLSPSD